MTEQHNESLQKIKVEVANKTPETSDQSSQKSKSPKEINGPKGLEPTRYGDWESKGRCYDF